MSKPHQEEPIEVISNEVILLRGDGSNAKEYQQYMLNVLYDTFARYNPTIRIRLLNALYDEEGIRKLNVDSNFIYNMKVDIYERLRDSLAPEARRHLDSTFLTTKLLLPVKQNGQPDKGSYAIYYWQLIMAVYLPDVLSDNHKNTARWKILN